MRVTTARREVVDLGPHQEDLSDQLSVLLSSPYFKPLPEGVESWRSSDRRWLKGSKEDHRRAEKRDYDAKHRAANLEHYRELERERTRRYRARQREEEKAA